MLALLFILIFVISFIVIRTQVNSKSLPLVVDIPNRRSSHINPTRSAGGVSIIVMYGLGLLLASMLLPGFVASWFGFFVGAVVIGLVGLLDDVFGVRAIVRLIIQIILAIFVLSKIIELGTIMSGETLHFEPSILFTFSVSVLGFVWLINLYNFMDGIDGYAGSQTIFVCVMSIVLLLLSDSVKLENEVQTLILALAMLANVMFVFLFYNWPKSSIFMGDTGSGFIGFHFGVVIALTVSFNLITLNTWLVLLGLFVVDSTFALIRRIMAGVKFYEAHRSHAYQNLSRKYSSHRVVTIAGIVLNLVLIAPAAIASHMYPSISFLLLAFVYLILGFACFKFGSGVSGLHERPQ